MDIIGCFPAWKYPVPIENSESIACYSVSVKCCVFNEGESSVCNESSVIFTIIIVFNQMQ